MVPLWLGSYSSTNRRKSQGPALTFLLQKWLQILIQALLIIQHKFEDRCQFNLCWEEPQS